jgi:hypothetical protein
VQRSLIRRAARIDLGTYFVVVFFSVVVVDFFSGALALR